MRMTIGASLLFSGLFLIGFTLAEGIVGDGQWFLEWWVVAIPLAWLGKRLLRGNKRISWSVAGVVALFMAWIVADPDSLRPRIQVNEERAVVDVRAVMLAEQAYASANDGCYDRLECMVRPAECIPSYPADGRSFLREPLDGIRSGFIREFFPGPPARADAPSTSAVRSYAFVAYPAKIGETGVRSFCGDSTGQLRVDLEGGRPPVLDGLCDPALPLFE